MAYFNNPFFGNLLFFVPWEHNAGALAPRPSRSVFLGLIRINRQRDTEGYFKYHVKQNILLHLQNKQDFIAHISWIKSKKEKQRKQTVERAQGLWECLMTRLNWQLSLLALECTALANPLPPPQGVWEQHTFSCSVEWEALQLLEPSTWKLSPTNTCTISQKSWRTLSTPTQHLNLSGLTNETHCPLIKGGLCHQCS